MVRRDDLRGAVLSLAVLLCLTPRLADAAVPVWGADDGFKPWDSLEEIKSWFNSNIPSTWFINQPEKIDKGYRILVTIDALWAGNPVQAAMSKCPPRYHVLWQHMQRIVIQPRWRKVIWPEVECR